jgi:hypothetical protein
MILNPDMRCWDVRFTEPHTREITQVDGSKREYTSMENRSVIVVADSSQMLIQLLMDAYPTAMIMQVNHRGKGSILVQDAKP